MSSVTQTVVETAPRHLTLQNSDSVEPQDVEVEIVYTKKAEDGTPITIEAIHGNEPKIRETRSMLIKDVRPTVADFKLEKNGFEYLRHHAPESHFVDEETIKAKHFPEVEALIKEATGAKTIIVFNHVVRNEPWATDFDPEKVKAYKGPAQRCHIDLAKTYAPQVVKDQLKLHKMEDQTDEIMAGKWQVLNVWRPLKAIKKHPLAVADSSTVPYSDQNIIKYDRTLTVNGTEYTTQVENCFTGASKDNSHQFYYMHEQQPDEVLVFKTAESDEAAEAGAVTHTSFDLPDTAQLPTRQSIEVRLIAIY